ncbi:MAG: hypothetical protein HND57_12075 [Planctomycetes bacterium]|nr:hypothetical protein [Planctomycetota bacterium]
MFAITLVLSAFMFFAAGVLVGYRLGQTWLRTSYYGLFENSGNASTGEGTPPLGLPLEFRKMDLNTLTFSTGYPLQDLGAADTAWMCNDRSGKDSHEVDIALQAASVSIDPEKFLMYYMAQLKVVGDATTIDVPIQNIRGWLLYRGYGVLFAIVSYDYRGNHVTEIHELEGQTVWNRLVLGWEMP